MAATYLINLGCRWGCLASNALTADSGLVCVITASGRLCDSLAVALIYAILFRRFSNSPYREIVRLQFETHWTGFLQSCLLSELSGCVTSITPANLKSTLIKFCFAPPSYRDWDHLSLLSFWLYLRIRRKRRLSQIAFLQRPRLGRSVCVWVFVEMLSHGNLFKGPRVNCLPPNHTE